MNIWFQIFLASLLIVVFLVSSKSGKLVHAAVFGGDERQKVQDTNIFPWNGVVQIQYTVLDQNNQLAKGLCSGTFINAHTVLTAAHCLYSKDFNHWDSTVTLRPGVKAGIIPTYGEYTISPAAPQLRVPPEYVENVNDVSAAMYDYGVILLPDDTFGQPGRNVLPPHRPAGCKPGRSERHHCRLSCPRVVIPLCISPRFRLYRNNPTV